MTLRGKPLEVLDIPVFTSWGASGCMECELLSPARLEYSNYRRLACTVWLVDHWLDYSPPGINEPVEDEERWEEEGWKEEGGGERRQKKMSVYFSKQDQAKKKKKTPWKSWHTKQKQTHCQTTLFLLANQSSDMEKLFSPKQPWALLKPRQKLHLNRLNNRGGCLSKCKSMTCTNLHSLDLYTVTSAWTLRSLWGEA